MERMDVCTVQSEFFLQARYTKVVAEDATDCNFWHAKRERFEVKSRGRDFTVWRRGEAAPKKKKKLQDFQDL